MPNLSRSNIQTTQRRGDGTGLNPTGPGVGGSILGSCTNAGTIIRSSNLLIPFLDRDYNLDVDNCSHEPFTMPAYAPPTWMEPKPEPYTHTDFTSTPITYTAIAHTTATPTPTPTPTLTATPTPTPTET